MKPIIIFGLVVIILTGCSNSSTNKISSSDSIQEIEEKLRLIMETPAHSSNPYDYINEHKEEYMHLVNKGETALEYFMDQFSYTDTNGLKEYIMAVVCIEIIGNKNPVSNWVSGRSWYNQYVEFTLREEHNSNR